MNTLSRRILFTLGNGFGLGDCVQASILLKHVRRYRPYWTIDVQAPRGCESGLHGLCNRVFWSDNDRGQYDQESVLELHEHYQRFGDRPNTKTTAFMVQSLGIHEYDADLGNVECFCSPAHAGRAMKYMRETGPSVNGPNRGHVIIHYQGGSSKQKKDLQEWQAAELCRMIIRAGRVPVVLDLGNTSTLPDQKTIYSPRASDPVWGGIGNGDASMIAALVRSSEAFIGIDSGPGKIASTTDTPTLICWTQHHPLRYHDPAENTLHLIPEHWPAMAPVNDDEQLIALFTRLYRFREYMGQYDLVSQAMRWLAGVLKVPHETASVRFVLRNDLTSVAWTLTKLRNVAQGRPIEVVLSGDPREPSAAKLFLSRFYFVRKITVERVPILHTTEPNTRGHANYVSDGPRDGMHFLIPDTVLQTGRPIEQWLPDVPFDCATLDQLKSEGWLP